MTLRKKGAIRKRAGTARAYDPAQALAAWIAGANNAWKAAIPGHAEFLALHLQLRHVIRTRYNRGLPLQDEICDRWERARDLGFGKGSSLYEDVLVLGAVKVGRDSWIGPGCILDGSGGLSIGHHCSISAGVHLYSHDTVAWSVTGGKAKAPHAATAVGDCCYVGPHTVVAKGVTIGRQSIVGAHSFVNRDVPPRTFVAGCPAQVLGKVKVEGDSIRIVPAS